MALIDELNAYATNTFQSDWTTRKGLVVPEPKDLSALNDTIEFERATVLYADMSGSTSMVDNKQWYVSAEIYKAFLYCSAKLITANGGSITAYDGDRVMGVFVGDYQASPAAICALKINCAVQEVIMPAFRRRYQNDDFTLRHVVGIDSSPLRVAKTGVRGDNDLVWVGRAANYAAKLTELSSDYTTWITGSVFSRLTEEAKVNGSPPRLMWDLRRWEQMHDMHVYGSTWRWKL